MPARVRRPTRTSRFGVSRREAHDASPFYERFTPPETSDDDAVTPATADAVDRIHCHDARDMPELPDGSVALVVTSPPYFAGKEYEAALGQGHVPVSYGDYLTMLEEVFATCARKLEPGGRMAVNVANLGRRPYRSLAADVTWILQDRLRLLLRGEIVWVKARASTGSCAWGSFQQPANPVLRDLTERIVVASKGRFDRAGGARQRVARRLPSEASISTDEFLEATTDVWEIPPESATRVGHPAPFPVELPERLIHLYTYRGDLVLDPFMGSGTTAVAAVRTGRHFVGYDTDPGYVAAALERVERERERAPGEQRSAKAVAREAIEQAGFTDVRAKVVVGAGVDVAFAARDRQGARWYFDVAGGFTSSRPGLRRADVLWKAVGKAAVVHERDPDARLVLLAPDGPPPGSPAEAALAAVRGEGRPVHDVVLLGSADDLARLATLACGR